jgi:hypothetical protein
MVTNGNRLRVRRTVDVPLREVSGICSRPSANGRTSLIAVGDAEAKIAGSSLSRGDGSEFDWHKKRSIANASLADPSLTRRDCFDDVLPGRSNNMTLRIPEEFSNRLADWSSVVMMGNTMPPRDPDEDDEDDDEEEEEADEPPVVREPDED